MTDNEDPTSDDAWINLTAPVVQCTAQRSAEISTIQSRKTNQQRVFFTHIPPSICHQLVVDDDKANRLRSYPILLAFHGYTGNPMHEIKKWKAAAEKHSFIVVAPQGTSNVDQGIVEHKELGWNAIDCCGDPMTQKVNELDFALGVVTALAGTFPMADASNVVATGFSNGGFLTSLFGLQESGKRPQWLKGIVPTGGYQYNTSLYHGVIDPLPMFQHHGGQDGVVRPEGCCRAQENDETSNCPFDIGSLRRACLPVQASFHLWASKINGCDRNGTSTTTESHDDKEVVCMTASRCRAVTKLCIWTKAPHVWGSHMPGEDMVGEFLDTVFSAETHKMRVPVGKQELSPARIKPNNASTSQAVLLVAVLAVALLGFVTRRKPTRRKTSDAEDEVVELIGNPRL